MIELRAGSATDVGLVRANNQDQLLVAAPLFAVADGMGGHAAGEVASTVAVEALEEAFARLVERTPRGLGEAVAAANRAVWEQAQSSAVLRGMGTTMVALAMVGADSAPELAVANVGDSRAYALRHGELSQLTVDHSLVQELVDEGQLAEEDAAYHPQRHVLTRALGVDPEVAVDVVRLPAEPGDRFLLCSDGLIREVGDDQVASVLRRLEDPTEAARELVSQAREHGGNDNITVVVVDVADAPEPVVEEVPAAAATPPPAPPTEELEKEAPAPSTRSWRNQARRGHRSEHPPPARLITLRVVGFVVLLLALLGAAAAGIGFYARGNYFVGLSGRHLVIYQGRPGGLLWFQPTVAQRTPVTTSTVLPYHLGALRAGQNEGSLSAAQSYVRNLENEYRAAQDPLSQAATPASSSPPST